MHYPSKTNEPLASAQEAFLRLIELLLQKQEICDLSAESVEQVINLARFHGLDGMLFSKQKSSGAELISQLEKEWNLHRWTNILLLEHLVKIERDLGEQGIKVCRLKGASLLSRFYRDPGERVLADIDIFVTPGHLEVVEKYLKEQNFVHQPDMEFEASVNRRNWAKVHLSGLEISFDVHTKTHWRMPLEFYNRVVLDGQGFFRLDDKAELLHLIVNWVEQDTCVSFNKMWDIYLVVKASNLDWDEWYAWVKNLGHERSVRIVQIILKRVLRFDWKLPESDLHSLIGLKFASKILEPKFLMHPQQSRLKYYFLKHLTKEMHYAVLYDWLWLLGQIRYRMSN